MWILARACFKDLQGNANSFIVTSLLGINRLHYNISEIIIIMIIMILCDSSDNIFVLELSVCHESNLP